MMRLQRMSAFSLGRSIQNLSKYRQQAEVAKGTVCATLTLLLSQASSVLNHAISYAKWDVRLREVGYQPSRLQHVYKQ